MPSARTRLVSLQKEDEVVLTTRVYREKKAPLPAGTYGRVMEVREGGAKCVVEFYGRKGRRSGMLIVRRQSLSLSRRPGAGLKVDYSAVKAHAVVEAITAILRINRAFLEGQTGVLSATQIDAVLEEVEQQVRDARITLREPFLSYQARETSKAA